MSNAVPQKKTFFQIANKNFIMLFVAYTVICITHSMTNSVTSAGWRLAGMDLTTIGLIASAMSWAAFIIRPFSAPITDRGNKKLIYIAAVGALTLAVFMYSLSMDNSAFAVPAKIIHGVSWTFISTITAVIVSEYVPREDLGTAMGFFMISQMIASAVSQPVAFALAEYMGYASMLLVFTVISAFGLVLVCFTAPTKVPARLPGQSMFGGLKLNNLFAKEAISPMIINVAFQGTRTGITVFMAAFAGDRQYRRVCHRRLSHGLGRPPRPRHSPRQEGTHCHPDPRRPVLLCRPPVSRLCPGSDLVHYLRYPDRNRPEWHFSRTDDHLYAHRSCGAEGRCKFHQLPGHGHRFCTGLHGGRRAVRCVRLPCGLCRLCRPCGPGRCPGCGNFVQIGKAGKDCLTVSLPHISVRAVV